MSCFADTSFFLALANPSDQHHKKAVSWIDRFEPPMVVTAWVIAETGNGMSRAPARQRFLGLLERLR